MNASHSKAAFVYVVLILGLFVFRIAHNPNRTRTEEYSASTCALKDTREILSADCNYPQHKAFFYLLPKLHYGEGVGCRAPGPGETPTSLDPKAPCAYETFWGAKTVSPELGWDTYSVWYARAAALFRFKDDPAWPGYWQAIRDPKFVYSFPCRVCPQYPWLLSTIYAAFLGAQGSANPVLLQIVQVLVWLTNALLLFLLWRTAPRWLWVNFAFAPITGFLLFFLYGDPWVVLFGLLVSLGISRGWLTLAVVFSFLAAFLKKEAPLQIFMLLLTYVLLSRRGYFGRETVRRAVIALGALLVGYFIQTRWIAAPVVTPSFGFTALERMRMTSTYTRDIWHIWRYYLDVIFRATYWALLWPVVFWALFKNRKELGWAMVPLLALIFFIPLNFLQWPEGAFREVVLNGTNRPLYQSFPTVWLLMWAAYSKPKSPTSV